MGRRRITGYWRAGEAEAAGLGWLLAWLSLCGWCWSPLAQLDELSGGDVLRPEYQRRRTLSTGPSAPIRSARSLAPRLADVPRVVAVVHEASDALGSLATANLEQARQAVRGHRLLVATRLLPESYDIPTPYSEAPEPASHR